MDMPNPDQPRWDVALEALLAEQFHSTGTPLSQADLQRLGHAYTIRLDDLLDTLCLMVEHGTWVYTDPDGNEATPDRNIVKLLHANYRLNPVQLERLGGSWRPAG